VNIQGAFVDNRIPVEKRQAAPIMPPSLARVHDSLGVATASPALRG
jgi:hypothetical protein